ncbi:4-hydroxy-tetrahydrodipicolinate synthase [Haematospirillum sp. 15-248]|uniref:4-hydroxy-tetrahydrodipicolinate synthase n=1 Tax=Haematospirillum sp. 15-248 TaxID=2723107 RepID=UPI001438D1E1|nr:4-hydroxy-tetrahydrodipicolinate synthase [Haematospirillum sp. 15-248]NKD86931.1 4-hydroxy-tetrahydrodipicolinate synthase [Haematospirillum sp. 15-248]
MYSGSFTALITPFSADGSVDERAFQDFVVWQINKGTNGLVPAGTTGETPVLSPDEYKRLLRLCVEAASGRAVIMAGSGTNCTAESIERTRYAEQVGANAVMVVTPYYNKPTQEGLYQHYKAIHDSCNLPVFIYNIPGRSVVDISLDTMKRLAELPRIAGIKDATADLSRPSQLRLALGDSFCQFSGDDHTSVAFLAQGGHGCISVTSNIAPRLCADLYRAWEEGNMEKVSTLRDRLVPLHNALFCETNPAPVKYAASLMGHCLDRVRLPLVPASQNARERVRAAMTDAGLLEAVS